MEGCAAYPVLQGTVELCSSCQPLLSGIQLFLFAHSVGMSHIVLSSGILFVGNLWILLSAGSFFLMTLVCKCASP